MRPCQRLAPGASWRPIAASPDWSHLGPGNPWLIQAGGSPIPATKCVVSVSGVLLPPSRIKEEGEHIAGVRLISPTELGTWRWPPVTTLLKLAPTTFWSLPTLSFLSHNPKEEALASGGH